MICSGNEQFSLPPNVFAALPERTRSSQTAGLRRGRCRPLRSSQSTRPDTADNGDSIRTVTDAAGEVTTSIEKTVATKECKEKRDTSAIFAEKGVPGTQASSRRDWWPSSAHVTPFAGAGPPLHPSRHLWTLLGASPVAVLRRQPPLRPAVHSLPEARLTHLKWHRRPRHCCCCHCCLCYCCYLR